MRSFPVMILHRWSLGIVCAELMFEVLRTQGKRGKRIGESVERFPSAVVSGATRR